MTPATSAAPWAAYQPEPLQDARSACLLRLTLCGVGPFVWSCLVPGEGAAWAQIAIGAVWGAVLVRSAQRDGAL